MLNALPFVAGLIAGAAAVSALRGERARSVLQDTGARLHTAYDEAQSGARAAARSGFDLMRGCTTTPAPAVEVESAVEAESAAPPKPVKPARKSAAKTASAKAAAAKPAAAKPVAAKARRAPRKAKPEQAEA